MLLEREKNTGTTSMFADFGLVKVVGVLLYTIVIAWIGRSTAPSIKKSHVDEVTIEYELLKSHPQTDTAPSPEGSPDDPEGEPLSSILDRFGSDKSEHHGYDRYYDFLLSPLRNKNVKLVEIGVEKGRSLQTWQVYFGSKAKIYGIGYGNFQKSKYDDCGNVMETKVGVNHEGQICRIYRGDQSDVPFLNYFANATGGNFDVLIDDGSHLPSHQMVSFETLWPHVAPGGVYVIEDVETSYWTMSPNTKIYGYSFGGQKSIIDNFKDVADTINREFQCGEHKLTALYNDVQSVQFGQNVIILRKAKAGDADKYLNRGYRFKGRLPCQG